jgi:uncharacterized membrane protein
MTRLVLGVMLWSVAHLIPAVAVDFRKNLVERLGENPYKGIFTLLMVLAIYLVVTGWKSTLPETLYMPPGWGRHATALLMLAGLALFFAPYLQTNVKRFLRHPQLTGVVCWGAGHLLANGDSRSVVLFGGLAAWAIIEVVMLNRRDGARSRPEPAPIKFDALLIFIGVAAYAVLAFSHQWLFGVSPFIA